MLCERFAMTVHLPLSIRNEPEHRRQLWKIRFRQMSSKTGLTISFRKYSQSHPKCVQFMKEKVREVLVESVSDHDASMVTGRMSNNLLVHFKGTKEIIGTYVTVHLTECKGFYYLVN